MAAAVNAAGRLGVSLGGHCPLGPPFKSGRLDGYPRRSAEGGITWRPLSSDVSKPVNEDKELGRGADKTETNVKRLLIDTQPGGC